MEGIKIYKTKKHEKLIKKFEIKQFSEHDNFYRGYIDNKFICMI
jgi:hypothetical protein